jgi:hypothetical protein
MTENGGLTLVELISSFGLSLLLLYMVLGVFRSMNQAFTHGDGRIVLQQRARTAFARVTPLLVTAVAPDEVSQAVDFPPVVESFESPGDTRISFFSPIDFFSKRRLPSVRNPEFYHYEIYLEDRTLQLRDLERKRLNPQLLAREIDSFQVRRVHLNAINLEVGVSLKKQRKEFRLETLVQLPYYTH